MHKSQCLHPTHNVDLSSVVPGRDVFDHVGLQHSCLFHQPLECLPQLAFLGDALFPPGPKFVVLKPSSLNQAELLPQVAD